MVVAAMNFVGVRYRRGGTSAETGFDCSGFTRHVFEMSLGLVLPRRADEQAAAPGLVAVKREDLQPGDLVFFNTLKRTFSHVGIYIGDNRFIHAPRPASDVRTEDMSFAYWAKRFTGARRAETTVAVDPAPAAATPPRATAGASPVPPLAAPRRRARRARGPRGTIGAWPRKSSPSPTTATARALPVIPARLDRADRRAARHACSGRCATCASRSPTAATSAAATACRRKCSTSDYAFLPQSSLLSFEEIARVAGLFVAHGVARRSA